MKKILVIFLSIALLLCGCAGAGDWDAQLVEDYAIWRINGCTIVLVRETEGGIGAQTVIDSYIYRVTWNEEFICVQQTTPPEIGKSLPINPKVVYYILRVSDGEVFGAYTAAEYKAQCEALGVSNLPDWVSVQDLDRNYE